jgi:hypothetical protein
MGGPYKPTPLLLRNFYFQPYDPTSKLETKAENKKHRFAVKWCWFVELAGVEPASKQAAKTLSTCLSSA